MSWLDRTLADEGLSQPARELAKLFAKYATGHDRYSSIVESEGALTLQCDPAGVHAVVDELERHGHLKRLRYGAEFQIHVALALTPVPLGKVA